MSKFDTHGGHFAPQGYMRVNAGGSHEENPNGGVQVGVDPQGVPNMVEEGEPIYNDYVYSDNIVSDEELLKKHNIPAKYAGKLYSEIADLFVDEAAEMPLDPVANNGLSTMLVRLAEAQEEQKAIAQQKELEEELSKMSPEELAELEQILAQQEAPVEQAPVEQPMMMQPQEQVPVDDMQMQQPIEQPIMACGGKIRKYDSGGKRYRSVQWPYENSYNQFDTPLYDGTEEPITPLLPLYERPVRTHATYPDYAIIRETNYQVPNSNVNSKMWPYGPFFNAGVLQEPPRAEDVSVASQSGQRTGVRSASASPYTTRPANTLASKPAAIASATPAYLSIPTGYVITPDMVKALEEEPIVDEALTVNGYKPRTVSRVTPGETMLKNIVSDAQVSTNPLTGIAARREQQALPTWPRYTGAAMSGALALYNAFQEPDKYMLPRINPVLPFGRMHLIDPIYNPIDQNQVVNDVLASGAGTTRAINNAGMGPAVGQTLLAQDYNIGRNLGNALASVWDANNQRRNPVISARNQNAGALGNFHYGQSRDRAHILNSFAQYNASNDIRRQMLNYQAEAQKYAAIQQQLDNLAEALAGIGRENFYWNQINNNTTLDYKGRRNGTSYYNPYGN